MNPDEYDTSTIIVLKMTVVVLTAFVSAVTVVNQGIKILKSRNKKMGFRKEI